MIEAGARPTVILGFNTEREVFYKEEFEKLTQAASEDRKIREVEELFDKDPIKRISGAGKLLAKWKQDYRKMI